MKFIWSILLALLPFLKWGSQYVISKKNGLLKSFKKHWTAYYADWLFVGFNFFFLYAVNFSKVFYLFLVISLTLTLCNHHVWGKNNKLNKGSSHFFQKKSDKLNLSGVIHIIFSAIEMTFVLSVLFLSSIIPFIFGALFFTFLFGISMIYGSYKIHGKISKMDGLVGILIIFIVVLKVVFLIV
jgi:hypothetical protein